MRFFAPTALLISTALPALANDGWGGISATGLTFGQTEDIVMMDEDLYIGPDDIRVAYIFKNTSSDDVTGEVIFPLPPISVAATNYSEWNLPDDRNAADLVDFKAVVDGMDQPVTIDRVAVIEPPWDENAPLSQQYDSPGQDVTAELEALGIPLTVDAQVVDRLLMAMSAEQRKTLTEKGLAEFYGGTADSPDEVVPLWSVVLRYHWTQTFPAGSAVGISHSYLNRSPGGLFSWTHPADEYRQADVEQYCIDDGTSKAMAKTLLRIENGEEMTMGVSNNISYVLRTANSWAGPIGHFKLTLDKGAEENIISLCADGLEKTSPTTFVMEKTDFIPDRDLEILLVKPMYPIQP